MTEPILPAGRAKRWLIFTLFNAFNAAPRILRVLRIALPIGLGILAADLTRGTKTLTLEAIGSGLLVFAFTALVVDAFRSSASVRSLSVPQTTAQTGWTGEACANRIADVLASIARAGQSSMHPLLLDPGLPVPSVEVPGSKMDSAVFVEALRGFFGSRRAQITGEVTASAGQTLQVRLRAGNETAEAGPGPEPQLDGLLASAAMKLAEQIAPFNLALALVDSDDPRALQIAQAAADRRCLPLGLRAACHNVAALLLFWAGRDADAVRVRILT